MLKGKIFYFEKPLIAYMKRYHSTNLCKGKRVKITAIKAHFGCNSGLGIRIDGYPNGKAFKNEWFDIGWITTKKKEKPYFMGGKITNINLEKTNVNNKRR